MAAMSEHREHAAVLGDTGGEDWVGEWQTLERAQRRDRLRTTPGERLQWLEEALELAHVAGALEHDRRRRGAEAEQLARELGLSE